MAPKARVGHAPCGCSALLTMALGAGRAVHCTAYHLILQREELLTTLLDAQMALIERHLCAEVREAWTDVGVVGVGRRRRLGKSDNFSQIPTTLGWTPPNLNLRSRI